ncbi:MAG: hypothetical protein SPL78_08030 [Bacteroidales bacterium]|nr:hypothetical protein [Bacteroidales bacterium]
MPRNTQPASSSQPLAGAGARKSLHTLSPTTRWRWSTKSTPPSPTARWHWSTKKPAHPLSHHSLAFFLHVKAGCIWESGNVLQGIAL